MSEKDVLQKIVEGIDINSEDELEFHDAVDSKTADAGENFKEKEGEQSIEAIVNLNDSPEEENQLLENKQKEDNVDSKRTISTRRNKKDSSNEEETIENIQSLLNTGDELCKAISESTKESHELSDESEITEQVDKSGVFISISSNDNEAYLSEEGNTELTKNPLDPSPEIPQVMLDQLDLKKFPNLKIGESQLSSETKNKKGTEHEKKNNAKLLAELQKRMDLRKAKQTKSQENSKNNNVESDKEEVYTPGMEIPRKRGRPRKVPATPVEPGPVNTKFKLVTEPDSKKGTIKVFAKPVKIKDDSDDSESEVEEEPEVVVPRARSSRKIKLTDKFKTFVAQEKVIKEILSDENDVDNSKIPPLKSFDIKSEPTPKKSTPATPKGKPKSEVQIKLKNTNKGKESTDGKDTETDNEDETENSEEEENQKNRRGRTLRKSAKRANASMKKNDTKPAKKSKKVLMSESELSDGYEVVDDEDMDPDFDDADIRSDLSALSHELDDLINDGLDDDDDLSFNDTQSTNPRTVLEMMQDVFKMMPTWNLHILPNTNTFCIAQIVRGVNGVPSLKKSIEMDLDFNVKVYVHQLHCKKFDGVYDSEDRLIELLQLVDAM
ncbi:myb-like protein X [Diaphorina citri]|uniref:Myb-like protein X n=1 Tax=Diaphorina citri TaxID=121845 RepID=A0A1S3DBZ3_DIACI|nr:myb-like protein X [Diaphorina citri]KAI5702878.1 hypothetical protein M8J75_005199 [Diaphorina citri]